MSDFSNLSPIDEKFNLVLNANLLKVIRTYARNIMTPYFRKVAITTQENENGQQYPVLTSLAERIISQVYQEGELSISSWEKAKAIALPYAQKLRTWEKECLAFYFCTGDTFVENLEEEGSNTFLEDIPEEQWDKVIGNVIQESIKRMTQNVEELASQIVNELVHLQDIFSIEDENTWDASSIALANENICSYTGTDIKLIAIPIDDQEYWDDIIEETKEEDDEEEEDDQKEDDLNENTESITNIPNIEPDDIAIENKIKEYIFKNYSNHIDGKIIRYGKASLTLEMLISGSIETYKANPERDILYIVDYMFDYFCT
ncbi:MAG: hypothetical protein K1X68_05025 [Saprospiraceae bacterium]|nr:hypothetical protein [Saprospiraceae bacterium]MBX7176113.1 hypothetical protein [Saprospiraceae bacterium]HMW39931.1 hypothetical protein [Saprospiraceae bacterium]HMZ39411.1 hypothetical protein [Saprospiraceae bacterium]HNB30147.1 hypothetical protein [Saprospiraceae bacterium]